MDKVFLKNPRRLPSRGFFSILVISVLPLILSACASTALFSGRQKRADFIAEQAGLEKKYVKTADFTLLTYRRFQRPCDKVRIYIEGDGRAWEKRDILSSDPTPYEPMGLELAIIDPYENVIYIARPGQFSESGLPQCDSTYWSERRFSPEVVHAINQAIDIIKKEAGAREIELVGYSGGAAIAILVAAEREDVLNIRTVAGNLDHAQLNAYHHVSPLKGSLNPIDVAQSLKDLPQRHFVGAKDTVVPPFIAQSFIKRAGDKDYQRITVVDGATHTKGWRKRWKELLSLPF